MSSLPDKLNITNNFLYEEPEREEDEVLFSKQAMQKYYSSDSTASPKMSVNSSIDHSMQTTNVRRNSLSRKPSLLSNPQHVSSVQHQSHASLSSSPSLQQIMIPKPEIKKNQRMIALDILRGATVMLMIVVNNQPESAFAPFEHADWNGLTPTDCVFPFFLWIVGYAVGIVFRDYWKNFPSLFSLITKPHETWTLYRIKKQELDASRQKIVKLFYIIPVRETVYEPISAWLKVIRRTILLFCIGLFLNLLGKLFDFSHWRIFGVFQRISLCYFAVSALCLTFPYLILQIAIVLLLQIIYLLFMFTMYVPNCGRGVITPECSAESYLDLIILTRNHIYQGELPDPEGPLSTLSAIFTCFLGYLFFRISQLSKDNYKRVTHWLVFSTFLLSLGFFIHLLGFEFNKKIWSTSFAIFTPGIAGTLLSFICFIVDIQELGNIWTQPFLWIGSNPLMMYLVPTLLAIIMLKIRMPFDLNTSLYTYSYRIFAKSWIYDTRLSSIVFAIGYELIFWPLACYLYVKKIFIKL